MGNNLLIITGNMGSGGLERVTANVANEYAKMGWNVKILSLLDPKQKVFVSLHNNVELSFFDGFYKKRFPTKLGKIFLTKKWISFIKKEIGLFKPDNVLCMTLKICALTCIACKRKKDVRIVMREISDPKSKDRSQFENMLCFRICKRVDHIIFQTNWEKSCYPKYLRDKGSVVPNPAEVKTVAVSPLNKIVTMGRLCISQKSQDVLLDAFSIFIKSRPSFTLEIYGEGPDKQKIENMIIEKGLEKNAFLKGAVKTVHESIKDAMIFVLPSEYEGLSNALIESMIMGLPCISSDWHGVEDLIEHKQNGLLFQRGDFKQLASEMLLLSEDFVLRKTLIENSAPLKERLSFANIFPLYRRAIEGDICDE
jgi:glycosyltransferase involved in cell wall biosynthesis